MFQDSSLIPLFIGFAVNRSQTTNNPTRKSALELFTIDRLCREIVSNCKLGRTINQIGVKSGKSKIERLSLTFTANGKR